MPRAAHLDADGPALRMPREAAVGPMAERSIRYTRRAPEEPVKKATRRRLAILLALLATALPALAQTGIVEEDLDPDPAVDAALPGDDSPAAAAAAALAAGDFAAAASQFRAAAEAEPDGRARAALRLRASRALFLLGDTAGARRELEAALYAEPATPLVDGRDDAGFVALHQDALAAVAKRRERDAVGRIQRAAAALAAGRNDEARGLLDEALRLAPDDPEALYDLALVDLRTGREDAALAGFERVIALGFGGGQRVPPDLKLRALNNAAVVYLRREQAEDAATALGEATRLAPGDAAAWFNLGLAREKLGERDAALEALRRAHELAPRDVATLRQLGVSLVRARAWDEAAERLLRATELEPSSADLARMLGQARRGRGDLAGATAAFRRAIELDPGNRQGEASTAGRLLAETRLEANDPATAAAAAAQVTALRPEEVDGWALLGLAKLRGGDAAAARTALERATALDPSRADVAHNLGTARLDLGDLDGAEAAYRHALELDPTLAASAETLARIAERRASLAAAAEDPKGPRGRERTSPESRLGASLVGVLLPESGERGLRVESLDARGSAARAGLAAGDVLLRVDGRPVGSTESLLRALGPGRPVRVEIQRDGERRTLLLAIGG